MIFICLHSFKTTSSIESSGGGHRRNASGRACTAIRKQYFNYGINLFANLKSTSHNWNCNAIESTAEWHQCCKYPSNKRHFSCSFTSLLQFTSTFFTSPHSSPSCYHCFIILNLSSSYSIHLLYILCSVLAKDLCTLVQFIIVKKMT